jgi:hypothetical protein
VLSGVVEARLALGVCVGRGHLKFWAWVAHIIKSAVGDAMKMMQGGEDRN